VPTKKLEVKAISVKRLIKIQIRQRLISQKTTTKTSLSLAKTVVLLSVIIIIK
jgi:hypothetical protein